MTATLAVARLDLSIVRSYLKALALLMLSMVMLAFVNGPLSAPLMFVLLGLIVSSYPFSIGEKDRVDLLLASMPISRRSIVTGRYLSAMVYFVVMLPLGIAASFLVQSIKGEPAVSSADLLATAVAGFVFYSLAISVQFPLYFRYGYAKARLVSLVPLFAIAGLLGLVMTMQNPTELIGMVSGVFSPAGGFLASAAAVGLLALSITLTSRAYRNRDI